MPINYYGSKVHFNNKSLSKILNESSLHLKWYNQESSLVVVWSTAFILKCN